MPLMRFRNGTTRAVRKVRVVQLAASAAAILLMVSIATPALAAPEVEFAIVGFGDKDCSNGSGKLKTGSAEPFSVEACVTDGGSPVSGQEVTALITHPDGTTEELALETDSAGKVLFDVVPIDAGDTTVQICIEGNCDFGVVTGSADNPPSIPAVASYLGPTADAGLSVAVIDDEGDFFDPFTGGPAEAGLGDPAIDIASFRYLGADGGLARFEITTHGDICGLFETSAPYLQLSVQVMTPDAGSYVLYYVISEGRVSSSASSEGAALPDVSVGLDSCDGPSTAILGAVGVDVPEGSSITGLTWLSTDSSSSGFQDTVTGSAVSVPVPVTATTVADEEPTDETTGEPTDETTDETAGTAPTAQPSLPATADSGSPIWIPLVVFGVAIGGYFLYRSRSKDGTALLTTGTAEVTDADLAQYATGDLGSYTDVYEPVVAVPTVGGDDWGSLLGRETAIQERYLGDFKSFLGDAVSAYHDYHAAITSYKEKFVKISSGSTDLQGYLQRWADNQQTAQKQDLAFGIITLVWGLGSLGLKAFRWVRAPKAAAAAESGAARLLGSGDELATSDTILAEGATVIDKGRALGDPAVLYSKYAAEVGVDPVAWDAHFARLYRDPAAALNAAQEALLSLVAQRRGWVTISNEAEGILNRLLVNGRSAVAGNGGTVDPADLAKLGEWVQTGGFWDKLLRAGGDVDDGLVLFYNADDVRFLRNLLDSGGDATAMQSLVGPAQEAALVAGNAAVAAAADIPGLTDLATGASSVGVNLAGAGGTLNSMLAGSKLTNGLDLGSYTDQFGGWVTSVDAGFGSAILDGVWGLMTSPFETFSGIAHTAGALDRYIGFLDSHGSDLTELGSAVTDALGSLEDLQGLIEGARLDDPSSPLGGANASDLRDLVAAMDALLEDAPADWLEAHGDEVEQRKAHISQKIADIERILDAVHGQLGRLGQMHEWIDGLRTNPDGTLRGVTELWNPELLTRLAAVDLAIQGILGSAVQGGSQPNPASAPPDQRPDVPDPFSPDYQPLRELDETQDEYEAGWQSELDEVFTDWEPQVE